MCHYNGKGVNVGIGIDLSPLAPWYDSLTELEALCTHLYIGTDLTQRIEAEKALLELIDSPECLSKCQLLLEQGTTSYAQLLAATCLSKLVSRISPLPVEQRIDIRNYILNYVASQPKLAPFVIQALIQVIAKITKLGWFEVQKDQFVFREIIADVKKFLQVDYSRPSAKHRKIATSFRDTSLKDILVLACSLLKEALACLVQFASTRRSLFSSPERAKYLGNLIKGVKRILENPQGLSDPGNYHEFCRFLARLKTNYQLGELVMVKEYPEVIRLIANFTITSLQHWEFAPNSVHYLLTLWQRMVASVPFVKSTEPHLLDTYAPEITKAFITSRLESVAIVVRDHLDDPLDDTATVFQQLEQLCTVSRCEYEKTCTLLVQLFDQNAQNYQKLLHSASGIPVDMAIQEGEDEDEFENFMLPLTVSFETVLQIFNNNFKQEDVKRMLIGLARDLRGIAFALNTKTSYTMLFDWMYPAYLPVLQRAVEQWYAEPACTTPILKLMAELMQNRSQRLNFDVSSPNGILLFREASKMICTYGNQILSLGSLSKDQIYPMKLKGISICYSALKSALCGNYVSFGVFKLYGDNHFDNVLQAFVKMLLSVSHSDLLQYRKLSQSYYPLLECLTQDHMSFITNLEPPVLLYVLTSISEGLTTLDTVVSSSCCTSLDHIVTYLFKHIAKEGKKPLRCREAAQAGQRLLHFMQQNPDVLQQMMSVLMNTIVFEDCRNQWSVSRPLLGLILLNEKHFSELRASLINSLPLPKQEVLAQCFRTLMEGVEQNLSIKNRDRFTQNLSVFRRDMAEALRCHGLMEPCGLDMMS
ncbi:Ran-binding protein 17 [Sciurus carolinensis]|uniref:Ran-binding protein 17 n=1 Tax=Sciurus carolinensis TaxID=30640 RepID=A0AA41NJQ9_SCICA|nr:Ran-binding protein 17 [Sciurus carolinensis]